MDVGRIAYNRPCRFFRNLAVASVVKWQEADPRAEALEGVRLIGNKWMDLDDWLPDDGPGEVSDSPRTKTLAHAPVGLTGSHVCGTPTDFALGGLRDVSLEPVRYGALGWPLCCDPPFRIRGGGGAGGRSQVVVRNVRIAGGAGAGGKSAYAVDPIPTPGATCEDAPTISLGVEYGYHLPAFAQHWFKIEGFPGGFIRTQTTSTEPFAQIAVYTGGCDSLFNWYATAMGSSSCSDSASPLPAGDVWISVAWSVACDYTFTAESGVCP